MTSFLTILGILLVMLAIPFGLMLAPFIIGVLLIAVGLRRIDRTVGLKGGVA
jgi:hypothetical protein